MVTVDLGAETCVKALVLVPGRSLDVETSRHGMRAVFQFQLVWTGRCRQLQGIQYLIFGPGG
jgi:hypothetical protein